MNLGDLTSLVEKPIAAISNIVNTPNAAGRFDDSAAAQGGESADKTTTFDKRSETFVRATRGIHW